VCVVAVYLEIDGIYTLTEGLENLTRTIMTKITILDRFSPVFFLTRAT